MAWGNAGAAGVVMVLALGPAAGCSGGATARMAWRANRAAEVQQAAAAALEEAGAVHVTGEVLSRGRPVRLDLRVTSDSSSGRLTIEDAQLEVVTVGTVIYLKTDQAGWQAAGAPAPAPVAGFAGQWVASNTRHVNVDVIDLKFLMDILTPF